MFSINESLHLGDTPAGLAAGSGGFPISKIIGPANVLLEDPLQSLSGFPIIDTIQTTSNYVVLRNCPTTQESNGLWVTGVGTWTRLSEANEWSEIYDSTTIVTEGTPANVNSMWKANIPLLGIIGVDPIVYDFAGTSGVVGEAPVDGILYGRKDASWSPISTATYGDIKIGMQVNDHSGWIKLDGRATNTLTGSQQTQATNLGMATNIINATLALPMQASSGTLGTVSGSMSKIITQANLPNVNLTAAANGAHTHTATGANTSSAGAHEHTLTCFRSNGSAIEYGLVGLATDIDKFANIRTADSAGEHTHTVSFTLANSVTHTHTTPLGGAGTALDITPKTFNINYFIYLGV